MPHFIGYYNPLCKKQCGQKTGKRGRDLSREKDRPERGTKWEWGPVLGEAASKIIPVVQDARTSRI